MVGSLVGLPCLAQAGSAVAVLARDVEKNQRLVGELEVVDVPAVAVKTDVADRSQLPSALQESRKSWDQIIFWSTMPG
jgi:NADP-dependent 3-hydroxy acid dehydrogenase YdfG